MRFHINVTGTGEAEQQPACTCRCCNCPKPERCLLNGHCLTNKIVYKAIVETGRHRRPNRPVATPYWMVRSLILIIIINILNVLNSNSTCMHTIATKTKWPASWKYYPPNAYIRLNVNFGKYPYTRVCKGHRYGTKLASGKISNFSYSIPPPHYPCSSSYLLLIKVYFTINSVLM